MTSDVPDPKTEPRPAARWDFLTIVLCFTCVALTVLVFLLARQNRSLKAQLAAPVLPVGMEALAAGDVVPPFDATVEGSGQATRVEFGKGEPARLLLVFSPDCPACGQNMPVWNRVLVDPLPDSVRVVGLNTGGMDHGDVAPHDAPSFPVLTLTGPIEKIPFIPATVLVNGEGTVQQVWFGVLGEAQEAELRAAIRHAASTS